MKGIGRLSFGIHLFLASVLTVADDALSREKAAAIPEPRTETADPTQWWSLRPLTKPPVPEHDSRWPRTEIDAFVLRRLKAAGIKPSPEADRHTLIRRLTYDLNGLPPTPGEIDAFVRDQTRNAYEKVVHRLLASSRYGERWGRHWLDVVHYGDSHGYDKDKLRPNAWPYRDYVIRAFNEDKPYRRFVCEQLAGDWFYPNTRDGIVALGFIAAGPFDWVGHIELDEGKIEKKRVRNVDRDDMVATAMNTFVSLTVQCARCHEHKFDPITQEDYYSLQAVFAAVDRADRPYEPDRDVAKKRAALKQHRAALAGREQAIERKIVELAGPDLAVVEKRIHELKQQVKADERPEFDKSEHQLEIAKLNQRRQAIIERTVDKSIQRELSDIRQALKDTSAQIAGLPPQGMVFAAAAHFEPARSFTPTNGKPRPIYLLHRGSVKNPIHEVGPGTLTCLSELEPRFDLGEDHNETGRRAALAEWFVDRRNPLVWRSIVNRIWHYHFGRGIVDTPNDFGRMGALPTYPELLDWLAVEFRDGGQSIKQLHRLIVTSSVYRQSSAYNDAHAKIDASNRYLWRMNRRRLEAEAIRDSVLVVSGKLDRKMYGPGFKPFGFKDDHSPHYKYHEHDPDDAASHRRSIYRFIVRSVPDPFMATLDCADPSLIVAKRNETITALQALALLNNKFMVRMAEHFAARVQTMGGDTPQQLTAAYRLAFGRSPSPPELRTLVAVAENHGLANACRLILNTNEFVFVD